MHTQLSLAIVYPLLSLNVSWPKKKRKENTYSNANYHGGIWRVSEQVFNSIATDLRIRDYRTAVETAFDNQVG